MYNFKSSDSIAQKVSKVIKTDCETRGESFLLTLGYGPSNDYAQSVAHLVSARFETVARCIRRHKEILRKKQEAEKSQIVA